MCVYTKFVTKSEKTSNYMSQLRAKLNNIKFY